MATRTSGGSHSATSRRGSSPAYPRRSGRTIKAAVDDFILDRESQHCSLKTIKWHQCALAHLVGFLSTQGITHLSMLEAVHLRAWMVFLEKEPGARKKARTNRTLRWYAKSMLAFCRWLHNEHFVEENPASRVKLPKLERPLIRIFEFEEFEALLAACAAPQEKGLIADRNTARNRALLWVL